MTKVEKLKAEYNTRTFLIHGTNLKVPVAWNQNIFKNIEINHIFYFDGVTFIKNTEQTATALYGKNDYTFPENSIHKFWNFTPVRPVLD
jgi:hypothetical protein